MLYNAYKYTWGLYIYVLVLTLKQGRLGQSWCVIVDDIPHNEYTIYSERRQDLYVNCIMHENILETQNSLTVAVYLYLHALKTNFMVGNVFCTKFEDEQRKTDNRK